MTSICPTSFPNDSYTSASTGPNTSSATSNQECKLDDSVLSIPLAFCYSIFFLIGLAGNLFALWVFLFVHGKKNSVRVFLINVAVSDLLLITCLPFRVLYHASGNHWTLGPTFCRLVGNVFYMNMYISITMLGLISVDRYIKIYKTSCSYRFRSRRWSITACSVLWVMSSMVTISMITLSNDDKQPNKCFQYRQKQGAEWKAYINCCLVALFWVVFLSLIISYGKIAVKLQRASREKPDLPNALKYNRTAKKSFFVLFLFTVCFVPYHVFRSFYIHSQIHEVSCFWRSCLDRTNEVVLLLSTFNSCLDPAMYFLLSGSVRKATLQIVNNFFSVQGSSTQGSQRPSLIHRHSTTHSSTNTIHTLRCTPGTSVNPPR